MRKGLAIDSLYASHPTNLGPRRPEESGGWGREKEVRHQKMERSVPGLGSLALSLSLARSFSQWCVAYGAYSKNGDAAPPPSVRRTAKVPPQPQSSAQLSSTPSVQIVFRPRFSLDASLAGLPEREEKSSGSKRTLMKCCRTKEHNGKMSQANMELHSADIENELESVIRSALIVFLLLCIYRTCRPHVYHFQGVFTPGLVSPHNIVYRLTSFP